MKKQSSALKKGAFLFVLMLAILPAFPQSKLLVGSWRLTAADKILPDGSQVANYGTDQRGVAVFTADGLYVIAIFRSEYLKFASGDRSKGSAEEYKDAVLSASCHFGTYTVNESKVTRKDYDDGILSADGYYAIFSADGEIIDATKGTITFHTERASYPNWDETFRVANFTLAGDELTWQGPPRPDGAIPISVFSRVP